METVNDTVLTREKIYLNAKTEFYNKGYFDTTLKSIGERADVPPSLIIYYFKSKDELASFIFDDFYRKVKQTIEEDYRDLNIENSLLKKMVLSYIYYDIILSDEDNKRFFRQTREKRHWFPNYEFHKEVSDDVFWNHMVDFNITMTNQEFELYSAIRSGARASFFKYYFENEERLNLDTFDIIIYTESIAPKMIGIDPKTVDSLLLKSKQLVKNIDCSSLKFLI